MSKILEFRSVSAGYGDLKVLFEVNLFVDEGEVVSLVGSNGAGKTTILRIIAGNEPITAGEVLFFGNDLLRHPAHVRAELGIAHIPQGRGVLTRLTVRENLLLGGFHKSARPQLAKNIERAYKMFPILRERQNQVAGQLSGGEQQMLAISRSLVMEPKLIMMDEPSLGLSPKLVHEVFGIIETVCKQGIAILLVEQNLNQALKVADRGYVLNTGHIMMEGSTKDLLTNPKIQGVYLGL
jgi:branched-chain amino acid transport system ATP-binding protein